MTLPCDIRIMAEEAKLGFIFSRVGLMTELGSSYFLPRLVGVSRAAEMLLTGRHYTAAECLAMGLVSQVVPAASRRQGPGTGGRDNPGIATLALPDPARAL